MKFIITGFIFSVITVFPSLSVSAETEEGKELSGQVQRVWEDGFQLVSNNRSVIVDSYDLCGDNTVFHIKENDQLTITGEFDDGEFDAFLITNHDGTQICQ
ncbi:MAG: hypothetical protein RI580_03475 [Halothece sp. Uz-M2-17]|nr:hypothetical protein [Halothece sp. Uz-M2-17]